MGLAESIYSQLDNELRSNTKFNLDEFEQFLILAGELYKSLKNNNYIIYTSTFSMSHKYISYTLEYNNNIETFKQSLYEFLRNKDFNITLDPFYLLIRDDYSNYNIRIEFKFTNNFDD